MEPHRAEQAGAAVGVVRAQVARGAVRQRASVARTVILLLPNALEPHRTAGVPPPPPRAPVVVVVAAAAAAAAAAVAAIAVRSAPLGQQADAGLARHHLEDCDETGQRLRAEQGGQW